MRLTGRDDQSLPRFAEWLAAAEATEPNDPNAVALATATKDGRPSVRIVLLKGWDERGFVIYTNLTGRKSLELKENPRAQLDFHWKTQRRQIRIEGRVEQVSDEEADAYFATRPRLSQAGAWASLQSQPLPDRATFEARLQEVLDRYPTEIPRPPHWSGWRTVPEQIEFWQDRDGRLHEREVFTRTPQGGWTTHLLYP
ncbi:MAG: pyridoxamine 5'-phosphate oxidase [Polymorphobacter sp.]|uniref:pyridoxamine 5'-phosphate oxidase n=1 Tax=Polymorphobacter sp. TaxID=1909290 RepID=UPI003A883132